MAWLCSGGWIFAASRCSLPVMSFLSCFFAIMGGIFTSINPEAKATLIQSMTVMGVTMGALIGLPPSLAEVYGSDIKKMYRANGVPLYLGLVSMAISAFLHLSMMSVIICVAAPFAFDAALPASLPQYACSLAVLIAVSLSIGSVLGLAVRNQAKLTMISQLFFLPSIMLSGILFPSICFRGFSRCWGSCFQRMGICVDGGGRLFLCNPVASSGAVCGCGRYPHGFIEAVASRRVSAHGNRTKGAGNTV